MEQVNDTLLNQKPVDEVDEVLVLEERSSNCATAIVHVPHVVVKTRQVFNKIFNLPYRVINNSFFLIKSDVNNKFLSSKLSYY